VLPLRRTAGEDLVGVRRVWLLSLPEAPGSSGQLAADLSARAVAVDGPQRLGALQVTRYTIAAPTLPLAYLPDRLSGAEVRLGETACPAGTSLAFACPESVAGVAREVREVDAVARPCILAVPDPSARGNLALTFPAVAIGRSLRGHAAVVGAGAAPVRLAARIDGEGVGAVEIPGNGAWRTFQLDTARFAGAIRSLGLEVTGSGPDVPPVCIEALTLP
jgi:hypothetical protein